VPDINPAHFVASAPDMFGAANDDTRRDLDDNTRI
jgi:hypothetical protein